MTLIFTVTVSVSCLTKKRKKLIKYYIDISKQKQNKKIEKNCEIDNYQDLNYTVSFLRRKKVYPGKPVGRHPAPIQLLSFLLDCPCHFFLAVHIDC